MRANFDKSYACSRVFEGGNVDDKADRGGRTSRGVTQIRYNEYRRHNSLPVKDVYSMTDTEAKDIYMTGYWAPSDCDLLAAGVDFAVFDYSLNSGVSRGKAAGQRARTARPDDGVREVCAERTSFVNAIRNFAKFRKGVLARVAKVETIGVKMALDAMGHSTTAVVQAFKLESKVAQAKADASATKSKAATVPAVASPAAVSVAADHLSPSLLLGLSAAGLVVALVAVYFVYQHLRHSARADAYTDATA